MGHINHLNKLSLSNSALHAQYDGVLGHQIKTEDLEIFGFQSCILVFTIIPLQILW